MASDRSMRWDRLLWFCWFLALAPVSAAGFYGMGASPDDELPQAYPGHSAIPALVIFALIVIVGSTSALTVHRCRASGVLPGRGWQWKRAFGGSLVMFLGAMVMGIADGPGEGGLVLIGLPIAYLLLGMPCMLLLRASLALGIRIARWLEGRTGMLRSPTA